MAREEREAGAGLLGSRRGDPSEQPGGIEARIHSLEQPAHRRSIERSMRVHVEQPALRELAAELRGRARGAHAREVDRGVSRSALARVRDRGGVPSAQRSEVVRLQRVAVGDPQARLPLAPRERRVAGGDAGL